MKLRGFGWMSVVAALVKELVAPPNPYPPVPFCVICHRPNRWIVQGESYGCEVGHHFDVHPGMQQPLKPPPPTDGGVI